ncbi:LTA synthase family protein [Rubrobacter taiwanensis]|uniref:LTA synthase family protein n=1 Tax=Rubrobacter taiwanensis TaxID=185139 RepID=UPI001FB47550|nr:LTA synthase family protein [Rubrobacter taiwanensis]
MPFALAAILAVSLRVFAGLRGGVSPALAERDRIYLAGLLFPLGVYGLVLRLSNVLFRRGAPGLGGVLMLLRSELFFSLAHAAFWAGAFAAVRGRFLRWVVGGLFHVVTGLVVVLKTVAHRYFRETGTALDCHVIALWLPRLGQLRSMLTRGVPPLAWALLAAACLYTVAGPRLLARRFGRVRDRGGGDLRRARAFWDVAFGCGVLALWPGHLPAGWGRSSARDPVLHVALTALERLAPRREPEAVRRRPAGVRLRGGSRRRNLVLVHLESTRASSVTPYSPGLRSTPFLAELAESSLLVERAYSAVPHTSKAAVSANCGIFPPPLQEPVEAAPGGLEVRGIAALLGEEGYRTAFFQSSTREFEDFENLAGNLGYEDYYSIEDMETGGFERANYFGYEDEVMLAPAEGWIGEGAGEPFVITYLTGVAHHDYRPPARYGIVRFSEDELLNRYLNCVRYQDFFVRRLVEQYRRLGLYEETIFVIYGDHGEGFGEHGRYGHEDVPYEEGIRVPLIFHAPGLLGGGRIEGPASLADILPTVAELLGYEPEGGEGRSLLRPVPPDRPLMFSCFNRDRCLASLRGDEKYIYHYGDRPDELFDLSLDPAERRNLARKLPRRVRQRRGELLSWYYGRDGERWA